MSLPGGHRARPAADCGGNPAVRVHHHSGGHDAVGYSRELAHLRENLARTRDAATSPATGDSFPGTTRMAKIIRTIGELYARLRSDHVIHDGSVLPARWMRTGGRHFQDDRRFLASGEAEADRLQRFLDCSRASRILDIGCGVGRLPIGIIRRLGDVRRYEGVDATQRSVRWCTRYLTPSHPRFRFTHLNVCNARYNPAGDVLNDDFRFPFDDASFDIVYLYSVFSHMKWEETERYVGEFRRLLAPNGKVFLTAFVEENVPPVTVNPEEGAMRWRGPLHCVRYERTHFEDMLRSHNCVVHSYEYGRETDGQSAYVLTVSQENRGDS